MKRFVASALFLLIPLMAVSPTVAQEIPLDPQYCGGPDNDYYVIPGEPAYDGKPCSRAPEACGNDYDSLNTTSKMPNPQSCMGDGEGREDKGCAGYVPACCYEMARTGDFTKCIGYWERLWCAQSQCDAARSKGASDEQCGGSCQCAHAFNSYCGSSSQPIPLAQRLGASTGPTNTPMPTVPANSTPTPTVPAGATATPTIVGNQPTTTPTSAVTCDQLKKAGNYNCTGAVDEGDFTAWKEDFTSHQSTLSFFEYWRRASLQ